MKNGRQTHPNIIFILSNQLRADECSCYGAENISTPHIDRLAENGVTFTNAVATCPLCTPYRGMLMSSRYPTHTGIVANFVDVTSEQNPNCLVEIFSQHGYDTGYIGKWHLSAGRFGCDSPYFRHAEYVPPGPSRLGFNYWAAYNFHLDFNDYWYYEDDLERRYSNRYETDTQFDQAIKFIKKRQSGDRPSFLFVSPHPHHPLYRPAKAPPGYMEKVPEKLKWRRNVSSENPRTTEEMRIYLAMENIDDNVDRLIAFLEKSSLIQNTIVIFNSDHGEMHGSHGRINKLVPYRETIMVPLIFYGPGRISEGVRIEEIYTPLDHLPTLSGLAGIPAPDNVEGIDLSDLLFGKGRTDREEALLMNYTSHWNRFTSQTPEEARRLGFRCWL